MADLGRARVAARVPATAADGEAAAVVAPPALEAWRVAARLALAGFRKLGSQLVTSSLLAMVW